MIKKTLWVFILSILLFACSEDTDKTNDCEFVSNPENEDGIVDPTEQAILTECFENAFNSEEKIRQNLIGEWRLIGYGAGWFLSPGQPCGYINIEKNSLTFDFTNEYIDTLVTLDWELTPNSGSLGGSFLLRTEPAISDALYMTVFCEDYMYSDYTPVDGNMYLYEKIK